MENNFLIDKIQKNGLITRFTSKGLQDYFKITENIPKLRTRNAVKDLLKKGIIVRKSLATCEGLCGSCYEYGCDSPPIAPINFYEIVKKTTI